jgi:Domain of unknown function (DUF397)
MSVEPELIWFKSSHSTGDGGQCVEIALRPDVVHVRDSKEIGRRGLAVDATAWTVFIGAVGSAVR